MEVSLRWKATSRGGYWGMQSSPLYKRGGEHELGGRHERDECLLDPMHMREGEGNGRRGACPVTAHG